MEASSTRPLEGLPPAVLEELKKSAERSQLRQLRRLQQLQKQAEYARQRDDRWRQKDEQSRERETRKQLEREESMRDRARRKAETDARREQNQNQAEEKRLEDLMRHQRKQENARRRSEIMANRRKRQWTLERRLFSRRQQKRDIVKRQSAHLIEEKRTAMFTKQEEVDRKLAKRHHLMERERRLQSYQKHMAEIHRQKDALDKSLRCEEERQRRLAMKLEQKERTLQHVQQEKEEAIRIKAEKAREYQENVRKRLAEKQERDAMGLEQQNAAFEEKISRAFRIQKQRDMVRNALSSVRRAMTQQEEAFRKQLEQSKRIPINDHDLSHSSTLLSTLSALSSPQTPRLQQQPSTISDEAWEEETDDGSDIHSMARRLTESIDRELMKEIEGIDHLTLSHSNSEEE